MKQFELRWRIGTKEQLAYKLIKYTGHRHSDIVRLGRQHEKDGWLIFTQHKGRAVNPQHRNYLVSNGPFAGKQRGYYQSFTEKEFGNVFRDADRAASLDGISAHGLRKAFAAQQAEQESSISEIAATVVTGSPP